MSRIYFILCLLGLVCVACQPKANTPAANETTGFSINHQDDSTFITIYSPWQKGHVLQQLAIGNEPLAERVVCTSATHIGFIHELGMKDKVIGVSRPDRIYNITDDERQRIVDIGDDFQPNMEALLLCKPDLVIISSYMEGDALPQQIQAFGIPVLYCNEWMETTPLARAEWIRIFGAIFGCQPKADSIYNAVCEAYNTTQHDTTLYNSTPRIMSGMSWRGTWYVPAGGTFMGHLFRDAGAQYKYEDNPSTSSIPLTMEQAIQDFAQADIWVGCEANSLKELETIDKKHTWFKAFQTEQVYNFRRRTLPSGANDFWESATVHPERILSDLNKVLLGDTTALYYTSPLK